MDSHPRSVILASHKAATAQAIQILVVENAMLLRLKSIYNV